MDEPGITKLVPGRLYALSSAFALDGRVSWYPPQQAGFSAINAYLLVEGGRALLIDTGLAFHAERLVAQLRSLIEPGSRLSILYTRVGEFQSVSNTPRISGEFEIEAIYGAAPECSAWTDFGPERPWGVQSPLVQVPTVLLQSAQTIELGPAHTRALQVANSVLRLLTNHWVYDEATRTLFSGDVFTYVPLATADGPWSDQDGGAITATELARHLSRTRYWWLPNADTAAIRVGLSDYFAAHEVETIAPGYGAILHGVDVVAHHVALLDSVLEGWERERAAVSSAASEVNA